MKIYTIIPILLLLVLVSSCKQSQRGKSNPTVNMDTLNYEKIYGLALKAEVPKALKMLDTLELATAKDSVFKAQFEKRFKYNVDLTKFLSKRDPELKPILKIYQEYWRKGLLHPNKNYDETLKANLLAFFRETNKAAPFTTENIRDSTLPTVFEDYMESKGLHTVGFDQTGKFYDLLVWRTMKPKTYEIGLIDDTVSVDVYLMEDFISLGWMSYARLGNRYPGGWATDEALYAVAKGYDLDSEKFKVNYLKHEAQHFSDYQRFPKLQTYDLEYRGKLVEMYYGDEELYDRIAYFISNAKYDPENGHPFANYCIIMDMSQVLFDKDYVSDISKWEEVSKENVHKAAKQIYLENTKQLKQIGKGVKHYLGKCTKCGDYDL